MGCLCAGQQSAIQKTEKDTESRSDKGQSANLFWFRFDAFILCSFALNIACTLSTLFFHGEPIPNAC